MEKVLKDSYMYINFFEPYRTIYEVSEIGFGIFWKSAKFHIERYQNQLLRHYTYIVRCSLNKFMFRYEFSMDFASTLRGLGIDFALTLRGLGVYFPYDLLESDGVWVWLFHRFCFNPVGSGYRFSIDVTLIPWGLGVDFSYMLLQSCGVWVGIFYRCCISLEGPSAG